MTDLKKRDAPIPAESAEEARPWRLPFWTEPPVHTVEREPDPDAEKVDAESADDNSPPNFPTAEELEAIRREAYNAGLEQGLVEWRQQGHKDGYDAGFAEGQALMLVKKKVRLRAFRKAKHWAVRKSLTRRSVCVRLMQR